jgi:isoleucyl-tRNA synthetase
MHFSWLQEDGIKFVYEEEASNLSTNVMDRWIISYTQSLLLFVHQEMAAYRLYTVVPRLVRFVDYLTNWYVRMNRKRLKVNIALIVFTTRSLNCHLVV